MGASVLDAQRCGSSRSKRSTHVFKCKAPGLFQKLVESSTEAAPSSGSSMEKVPLSKGSATFYWIPHTLDTLNRKLRAFFRVIFFRLKAPQLSSSECSFYGVFLKKCIALSWELHEKCPKLCVLIIYRKIRWFWKVGEKSIYFWRQIRSSEVR